MIQSSILMDGIKSRVRRARLLFMDRKKGTYVGHFWDPKKSMFKIHPQTSRPDKSIHLVMGQSLEQRVSDLGAMKMLIHESEVDPFIASGHKLGIFSTTFLYQELRKWFDQKF